MGVLLWWAALCSVSVVNVIWWVRSARAFRRGEIGGAPGDRELRRRRGWQLGLSGVFMAVCAFRAIVPRADVQRFCLVDSWLASVAVGRGAASIAEICFAAQWALLLRELVQGTDARFAQAVSRLVLPLIITAEVCSWTATLTTCYLGNAAEESLWALAAILMVMSAASLRGRTRAGNTTLAWVLRAAMLFGSTYVAFMSLVDIPMYVMRWRADEAVGRSYLTFFEGVRDVTQRWVVTRAWSDWRTEIPWMTLYFTAVVWLSMSLVRAPALAGLLAPARARRATAANAITTMSAAFRR